MDTITLHLPEEIFEEIISNLPVKSLLRFRCVSKSWCCLIDSNRFIKTHLQKSTTHSRRHERWLERWQYIFTSYSRNPILQFMRLPNNVQNPIDDPINHHIIPSSKIVGHSNGLVCILNLPALFFLWNPSTRISIQLPRPDCEEFDCIVKLGFGWDEQSDACKVFAVLSKKETKMGKIYSSKTNSWKTVEHGSLNLYDVDGEFACGRIYWLTKNGYFEIFDLESELFGRIELPCKQMVGDDLYLKSLFQFDLCMVYYDSHKKMRKIWAMMPLVDEFWLELVVSFPVPYLKTTTFQSCFCVESLVPPVSHKIA
ncbi:F-box/kelch-repeat protein-like protein [Salvia divinorum]|uniref:F-box/kelch-repeat protein-like protein n=1 Tax=Salvia divinorum TaxID=28513 RepID=A0ABD1H8S9_SALDI